MSAKPSVVAVHQTEVDRIDPIPVVALIEPDIQEIPCADLPLARRVEAILLAADRPMSDTRIAELLGLIAKSKSTNLVRDAVEELNAGYLSLGCAFKIESVAGGRQVLTLPAFAPVVSRLRGEKQQTRLTQPAIETLAIVAYRQPIQRAEIEAIRGVASGEVLRGLLERRLVRIVGRAEELGRPMLYGTTSEFLKVFGLASLSDLPQSKELRV
ncbi:MAG: SMC-Scp complex subunit ScpB [Phycisphaerales bacterium]|nr:SMC-Scp complex subunit ScpB [Phycisphaerales bacterium]